MPLEALQNGRYRILRPLGSGSMGEVYLVEDTRITRQVAIKVIRTETAAYSDPHTTSDAARLFEREAKAIAKLNHPNILPLFDFGEEVVNGSPLAYMVMPYCAEGSLASWLKQRGEGSPLSPQQVAHFLRQAADALQHAHDNDIIHQDVKPQNFLIRSNRGASVPDLLLADFGIAKLAAGTSGASQAIRGTPVYMAPEQWEGHPVPASDQYALAVMVYQLLTGRPPFLGGPQQMMYQHFTVTPPPPSTRNPAITHDIDSIVLRALAKRPQERFPSIATFGTALEQALLVDGPTIINTQNKLSTEGIRAMLAISYAEALNGTSRTLTLTGGRRVRVAVPPGIQHGQVIRVEGQDSSGGFGGPTISLLLTIAIAPTVENYPPILSGENKTGGMPNTFTGSGRTSTSNSPLFSPESGGRTSISNNATFIPENVSRTSISNNATVLSGAQNPTPILPPYSGRAVYSNASQASVQSSAANASRRKSNPVVTSLIVGLVLLLILGSVGLAFYYFAGVSSTANINGTATANANNNNTATSNNGTGTAQANDTSTANALTNANATGTANFLANATATANAQGNANATATAIAQGNRNATGTAGATTATATATVSFTVSSVTMAVNPTSIAGIACGTYVTVTYTATFTVPANTPGGTVQFTYTINNGHSSTNASVTFAAGVTSKDYQFTWAGNLPSDHTYPGIGEVITSSPNQVTSQGIQPTGSCV
ncbi:MAG: hypothetical protein NVSMB33_12120 [Ktedonobacteraceae bacterium]